MADELTRELQKVDSFVIFNYNKMTSHQAYGLRKEMAGKNIKIKMVKTTIAKVVFSKIYNQKMEGLLTGSVGMAYGGGSAAEVSKALIDWNKKQRVLVIRGGYIPNRVLNSKEAEGLAKIPPRNVLLATLAGSFVGLLQQTATMLKAPLQNISTGIQQTIEKREKSGATAPTQPAQK